MALAEYEIPTVVVITEPGAALEDTPVSLVYDTTESGVVHVTTTLFTKEPTVGSHNIDSELLLDDPLLGLDDIGTDINLVSVLEDITDTVIDLWQVDTNSDAEFIQNDIFLYSVPEHAFADVYNTFKIKIGTKTTIINTDVELELSKAFYFMFNSSIFCVAKSEFVNNLVDIQQKTGRVVRLVSDIIASKEAIKGIAHDVFCAASKTVAMCLSDFEILSGSKTSLSIDSFCCGLNDSNILLSEFKTRSLFVRNFFLDTDKFTEAVVVGFVDIVDYLYPILNESISITIAGTILDDLVIEDIDNGKRVYFDPLNDFENDGEFTVVVSAGSIIGEIIEEEFYLLYGFDISLDEAIEFKTGQRIFVSAEASNKAFCPNKVGFNYYFNTMDSSSFNLPMYVNVLKHVDLGMSIYPQSTSFFYGKTFTVKISGVKDYYGNVMKPLLYSFTIETPD